MTGDWVDAVMSVASTSPIAFLDLPDSASRSALRVGLIAHRVDTQTTEGSSAKELARMLGHLANDPNLVVFADISPQDEQRENLLQLLDELAPTGPARQRVYLTRLFGGFVFDSDKSLVSRLGFGGLYGDFDEPRPGAALARVLAKVSTALGVSRVPHAELERYARVLKTSKPQPSPYQTVRDLTKLEPDQLVSQLIKGLDVRERNYRFRSYPHCFVGSDASSWLQRRFQCTADEAQLLGKALCDLDLIVHVTLEHPFIDGNFFYQFTYTKFANIVDLSELIRLLYRESRRRGRQSIGGYKATDHTWKTTEARDLICRQYGVRGLDAWFALRRLSDYGFITCADCRRLEPATSSSFRVVEPKTARVPATGDADARLV